MSKTTDTQRFWNEFSAALSKMGEKRPTGTGWVSLDDWVKASGENRTNVSRKLMEGVKLGLVERFQGMIYRSSGRLGAASWFRPLNPGLKPRSGT